MQGSWSAINLTSNTNIGLTCPFLYRDTKWLPWTFFRVTHPSCCVKWTKQSTSLTAHLGPSSSSRYIRGESPIHQQQSSVLLGHQVKAEIQAAAEQLRAGSTTNNNSLQHYRGSSDSGTTFIDTSGNHSHSLLQDSDQTVDAPDPYAMAMRRPAGGGLLNLTVTSDADLRRANGHHHHHHHHHGVPEHELRSAGVYLTLTNNH